MSDSPIESTKELHESKERKPEMRESPTVSVSPVEFLSIEIEHAKRNSRPVEISVDKASRLRNYMETLELMSEKSRVGLSRGAEPEPTNEFHEDLERSLGPRSRVVPPRGEAETPTDTRITRGTPIKKLDGVSEAYVPYTHMIWKINEIIDRLNAMNEVSR